MRSPARAVPAAAAMHAPTRRAPRPPQPLDALCTPRPVEFNFRWGPDGLKAPGPGLPMPSTASWPARQATCSRADWPSWSALPEAWPEISPYVEWTDAIVDNSLLQIIPAVRPVHGSKHSLAWSRSQPRQRLGPGQGCAGRGRRRARRAEPGWPRAPRRSGRCVRGGRRGPRRCARRRTAATDP